MIGNVRVDPGTPPLEDLTDDAVSAAARWWADHLRQRTPHDNGDLRTGLIANAILSKIEVSPEEIDAFEAALRAEFFGDVDPHDATKLPMDGWRIHHRRDRASVDYGPDKLLSDAIDRAVSDEPTRARLRMLLPIKSTMRIDSVSVVAAAGYGISRSAVWTACDKIAIGHHENAYEVIDRWRGGGWMKGGDVGARIAFVTLSKTTVEPTPIGNLLRGYVSVRGFHDSFEECIDTSFRDDSGGYLALVRR